MIDPNICKLVTVEVKPAQVSRFGTIYQVGHYRGAVLDINYRDSKNIKRPGMRRLWLKYSILNESYYLSDRA